jgi:tetratricopeptide (TPR) repeat protein
VLRARGDLAGARSYLERATDINEKVLGPDHPDTATNLNNLGTLRQEQGDLAGARPYLERALDIRERVLGPEHPDTATSLTNLGSLLRAHGDPAAARAYLERALGIREKRGDRYEEGIAFFQLGQLAIQLGRYAEGVRLVAICYLVDQEIGHADTEQDLRSLTIISGQLGYSQEGLDALLREVLVAYQADRGRGLLRAAFEGTAADESAPGQAT